MSNGFDSFQRALHQYTRYNKRELGPLLENRARRLQWELYRRFREIAPTKEKIDREAEALGFRIKRRKGRNGKRLSVKQELAARRRSIRWLSVSFLLRAWKARKEGQAGAFSALSRRRREIGKAIIRTAKGERRPRVRILSYLEGAAKQNAQRRIVEQSLSRQAADMRTYVLRKQREQAQRTIARNFSQLIGP